MRIAAYTAYSGFGLWLGNTKNIDNVGSSGSRASQVVMHPHALSLYMIRDYTLPEATAKRGYYQLFTFLFVENPDGGLYALYATIRTICV